MLHREIGALEVDREDAIPFGFRHLHHSAHLGNADIVVQDVDATIGLQAGGHHGFDLGRAGDIGSESRGLAAFASDDLHGLFSGRRIAVDTENLSALARKGRRRCLAIAPARADRAGAHHQCRLALEPIHRASPLPFLLADAPAFAHIAAISQAVRTSNLPCRIRTGTHRIHRVVWRAPSRPIQEAGHSGERLMPANRFVRVSLSAALLLCGSSLLNSALAKPFMIVGLDEKTVWDDDGKPILSLPGKDQVLIVDLASPESPKIVASLPLKNSVVGPPVNVDIDPTGSVALVADSIDVTKDGDALKQVPDT